MRLSRVLALVLAAGVTAAACNNAPAETNPPAATTATPAAAPMAAPSGFPAPPDVAAPPADATKTPSGLAYKILKPGTGTIHPTPTSTVTMHYTGWQTNGQMFESSLTRNEPIVYPLNRLIDGWVEGVQMMVIGEKRRLWIPESLAYKGQPGSPSGMLVFDVQLLDIK